MFHRRMYPGKQPLALGGVLLILLVVAFPAVARPAGWSVSGKNNIMLVSPGSQGQGGGSYAAISSNGRFVAFESFASDLVPGHVDDSWDVFVSDLNNSQTKRVSTRSDGTPVYNPSDYTCSPAMTGNGRYIVFMSKASDLVPGDDNAMPDIFLRDGATGSTRLVSVAANGKAANGPSFTPVISADGRFVAFQSMANNIVPNDTNDAMDVFVRDMVAGITRRVSITDNGDEGASPYEFPISTIAISGDGSLVAFSYQDFPFPDLTPEPYIFIRDQQNNRTELVAQGVNPAFSSDGRYLVFATNVGLDLNDRNLALDVYLLDRQNGTYEWITTDHAGPEAQEILSPPDISDDGRFVVFESSGGFIAGAPGAFHVYLRDRSAGITIQIDRSMDGTPVNGEAHTPAISDDGKTIAFTSTASNLVPDDNNNASDVFVFLNSAPSIISLDRKYFFPSLFTP